MSTFASDWGLNLVETDIDRLVIARLKLWLPTYLAQAERERNLPNRLLARPHAQSFQNVLDDDEFPDGSLPAILVTTASTDGDPITHGRDRIEASWRVVVSAIVRGRTPPEVREVAAVFGGCVRRILWQQQLDLEGELHWDGSNVAPVDDVSDRGGRYLAAGINTFTVFADGVLSGDGPVIPTLDDPPYPAPDPENNPDAPYDPLAPVTRVTTTLITRS